MAFYIVPKRKMIPPEKDSLAINIIQQLIEEADPSKGYKPLDVHTAWFRYRLRIPVGEDMYG